MGVVAEGVMGARMVTVNEVLGGHVKLDIVPGPVGLDYSICIAWPGQSLRVGIIAE